MLGHQAITRQLLVDQMRDLGIEPDGVLVVHASFRRVGPIDGGPVALIDALHEVLGPSGTLVMPSMTGSRSPEPYDPARTPTREMGIVAETFWRLPGTLRSDHPTSSFAANGPRAREITAPQPISPVHGVESPIGRVYRLGGSILLLGVGHDANTTIHLAESIAQVPYCIRKWATMLRDGRPERVDFDETDRRPDCGCLGPTTSRLTARSSTARAPSVPPSFAATSGKRTIRLLSTAICCLPTPATSRWSQPPETACWAASANSSTRGTVAGSRSATSPSCRLRRGTMVVAALKRTEWVIESMTARAPARPRPTDVDLGVCRAQAFDTGADRWVILLPGANYPVTAPLLWFAREAALAGGWNVLAVSDTFNRTDDPLRWVEERTEAAIRHADGPILPLLIAKSLTSLAAPLAARLGLPAVWLTPLIDADGTSVSRLVTDGLAAASAPSLLVGGSADPSWDAEIARSVPRAEVLEISGADHLLQIPGDVTGSVDALQQVVSALATFIAGPESRDDERRSLRRA